MLSLADISKVNDLPVKRVEVPEWGGHVYVRVLTGTERDAFDAENLGDGKPNLKNIRARLVARTMCNESGNRLCADSDAVWLGGKSAEALDRVFSAAKEINGLGAEAIEEAEKNSEPDQSEGSPSA